MIFLMNNNPFYKRDVCQSLAEWRPYNRIDALTTPINIHSLSLKFTLRMSQLVMACWRLIPKYVLWIVPLRSRYQPNTRIHSQLHIHLHFTPRSRCIGRHWTWPTCHLCRRSPYFRICLHKARFDALSRLSINSWLSLYFKIISLISGGNKVQ